MKKKDTNVAAMCGPQIGEGGKTGDWRSLRPVISHERCIPFQKKKSACFLCWLYCPEGVVKAGLPIEINLEYCKGCGICAEECPPKAILMVREDKS
ncbi:MAG: 4Fe-4S binding protein [Syntrophales bacterium]|nr:4Fe-4S binding protein [Syntrophales bacterium]MDD5231925.1 4Fe-4S binding protein [Syntrophales bacterium]HPL64069.1 4Fe-4S binding protein [Syntrophales bacterium]